MSEVEARIIFKRMGWEGKGEKKKFYAVLNFPDGGPGLPVSVVWDGAPIMARFSLPQPPKEGE